MSTGPTSAAGIAASDGATGPSGGAVAATKPADRQLTPTELEILASHRQAQRRAAQLGLPVAPKKTNGTTNVIPFSFDPALGAGNEPVDTGITEAFAPHAKGPMVVPEIVLPTPNVVADTTPAEQHSKQQSLNDAQTKPGCTRVQSYETLEAAEIYIRAGWHVFPGKRRDKKPKTGWLWAKDKLTLADAPKYFDKDQHNVLVVLGRASNDLVDVDLDWVEAAAASDLLMRDLPSFGRSGKPRSHRLAICDDIKTRKYFLPQSLASHPKVGGEHAMCIVEIRGSGAYTVFPGSEHETGQKVEWTNAAVDNMAAIQAINAKALLKNIGLLSFVAFCMRFFPAIGARCDFMMAVAGALAHAGYDAGAIQKIVQHIGAFNNDEGDNGTWRVAADSVTDKVDEGKEVTGLPTLIKILGLGDDVLKWCRELLGTAAGSKWPGGQDNETGKPKTGILNTIEAIKRVGLTCTYDEFRQKEYWQGHADKKFDGEVQDAAVTVTRVNICTKFRIYPKVEETREAITYTCHNNKSNPVLDYFAGLKWDGKLRLDKLAYKYLGADDTPLNTAISRKVMCAIVRRAKKPGCKFDHQWVLQGIQGIKKSTFCEDLAVFPDLYTDAGDLSGTIKDQMDIIQGKQIIEFPELAGYGRATRERNKASLSRKNDRARLSYAHYATDAPRRSVAIATTNEGQYLNDPTGERRYWHVAMAHYDRDAFLADKDQIYAEANEREATENLWLDTPILVAAHDAMVATVKAPNELVDLLADLYGEAWHVNGRDEERVSTADIRDMLGMTRADAARSHNSGQRIADAMKTLGWAKARCTLRCHKGQPPTTGYTRPLPFGPRNAPRMPVSWV